MDKRRKTLILAKVVVLLGVLLLHVYNAILPSQVASAASLKTEAGVKNWLDSVKNKQVKAYGGFGGECVDLARAYSQKFVGNDIGRATISGGAKDYASQAVPSGYIRINYQKGVKARTGDIAIWKKDGGGYGHMAVVYSVTGNDMVIYEQNYAGKRYVISNTVRNYDRIYAGTGGQVTAILRPTNISGAKPTQGANLDKLTLEGNLLTASGWFWPGKSYSYQYVFVMDAKTGREISRVKSTVTIRNDLKDKLDNQVNVTASGFNVKIRVPIDRQVYIMVRRTNDGLGDTRGGSVDKRFDSVKLSTNKAKSSLDKLTNSKNMISAQGWFFPQKNYKYQYVFVIDRSTNREVARKLINIERRQDVQNYLGNVVGGASTGFRTTFRRPSPRPSYIMIRRTNDRSGNTSGGAEDIRFKTRLIPA